ncbi:MAG: lipid A deacylase LpxR family protein [Rubrivivax sp.]|nr:MAG: lipid A deacylase LpxR family protein [Rubrivivax sp.]
MRFSRWATLAAMTLASAPVLATTSHEDRDDSAALQGWALVFENDLLGPSTAQDRWFTNGLQLATAFQAGREPAWLKPVLPLGRWLAATPCQTPACGVALTASLGQNIYTPSHIEVATPQPADRPWAGWLYGGIGLSVLQAHRHQALALKLGPTGPASLAEGTQHFAHCCLSSSEKRPRGWQHQLRPRLGVQFSYLSTHNHQGMGSWGWQTAWGGTLGNVRTMLVGAAALTWSIEPVAPTHPMDGGLDEGEFFTPDFSAQAMDGSWMSSLRRTVFYGHVQASAVAYNVFLEGRTYAGHSQITPVRGVATSTIGLSVPFGEQGRHKLNIAWKRRTPEFKVQGSDNRNLSQSWGLISYSHPY